MSRGWEVYRVEERGPNRIIWARRGEDEVVRVFATPAGERVAVRTVAEQRDRGRHRGWERREPPREIVGDIDGRLREHRVLTPCASEWIDGAPPHRSVR